MPHNNSEAVSPHDLHEVDTAMNVLKNNKTLGLVMIYAELLKYCWQKLIHTMHNTLFTIRNKEIFRSDWKQLPYSQ